MPHLAVSVICCKAAILSPRVVMMWANATSTDEPPSRAGPQYRPSTTTRSSSTYTIPASADAIVEDCARTLIRV